jgi:hypothetical protein
MKIVTLAGAAALLVASTLVAFAVNDTGTITAINWGIGTITLDNGNVYVVPPAIQSNFPLAVGLKVKLTQEDKIIATITKA